MPSDTPISARWWLLVVPACAVPLFVLIWEPAEPGGVAGQFVGVAMWTIVMMRVHGRLVERGDARRAEARLWGALGFAIVQAAGAFGFAVLQIAEIRETLVSPFFMLLLYWPVLQVASWLDVITDANWQPGVHLWLTLLSGAYVFLWVIGLSKLWLRFRRAPAPAFTPAG